MECYICGGQVFWGADFDFSDYGISGKGIVHTYTCSQCGTYYEAHEAIVTDEEYIKDLEEECENLSEQNRLLTERIRDLERERDNPK